MGRKGPDGKWQYHGPSFARIKAFASVFWVSWRHGIVPSIGGVFLSAGAGYELILRPWPPFVDPLQMSIDSLNGALQFSENLKGRLAGVQDVPKPLLFSWRPAPLCGRALSVLVLLHCVPPSPAIQSEGSEQNKG
jgi:hypothetical protein